MLVRTCRKEVATASHDKLEVTCAAMRGNARRMLDTLFDSGTFKSVVEIARVEGLMPATVGRLLRLARWAPCIVEQFMMGCQPRRPTLSWLMRNDIPALWPDQRQLLERFK